MILKQLVGTKLFAYSTFQKVDDGENILLTTFKFVVKMILR